MTLGHRPSKDGRLPARSDPYGVGAVEPTLAGLVAGKGVTTTFPRVSPTRQWSLPTRKTYAVLRDRSRGIGPVREGGAQLLRS
jgi:hypothetical protein